MNPSAEGASAPSAEIIGECRAYELQQLEVAEQSVLYTCGMQHLNHVNLFIHCVLVIRKGILCSDPMEV